MDAVPTPHNLSIRFDLTGVFRFLAPNYGIFRMKIMNRFIKVFALSREIVDAKRSEKFASVEKVI